MTTQQVNEVFELLNNNFFELKSKTKKQHKYIKQINDKLYVLVCYLPDKRNDIFDLFLIQANSENEAINEQGYKANFFIGNFYRVRDEDKNFEESIINIHRKCFFYLMNYSKDKNIEQIDKFLLEYANWETKYFQEKYNQYVRVFLNLNEYFK